ncbi:E3 ubiquitin-protein ligase [Canna indica]|uniref:RING-type E3 ubiquitin transferase n=1 Tax=Canna indica TaxID=4628 RepID=A0AAQ3Q4F9_9LILI|nr:E3 ubiquitin-protein ligase [Canna indica]
MPPFFFFLLFFISAAAAQPATGSAAPEDTISFQPGIAVVVGIFAIMFSLTFLLLAYAKFCHSAAAELFSVDPAGPGGNGGLLLPKHRFSGIDKAAIESLPSFRFASLRGARGGLECAVCLSKFDDADVLRLLPKCKHAFHVACVDRWLEAHSTCPLCRRRVDAEDAALFKLPATSSRFLFPSGRHDDAAAGPDLELFVEREPFSLDDGRGSSRFSIGSSFRKMIRTTNQSDGEEFRAMEEGGNGAGGAQPPPLHKFKHKIIVSDVVFNRRWSDVNSSDLLALSADMLSIVTSKRFTESESNAELAGENLELGNKKKNSDKTNSTDERILKIKIEMEKKMLLENKARQITRSKSVTNSASSSAERAAITDDSRALISRPGERSMSEIVNLSRFRLVREAGNSAKEEKMRRIWLPIARRTVQWFAGRERRSQVDSSQ